MTTLGRQAQFQQIRLADAESKLAGLDELGRSELARVSALNRQLADTNREKATQAAM